MFRHLRHSRAFTLIELLVVILIIGILLAIAAPSFLGQSTKAQDSAIQQQLAIAYRAEKATSVGNTNEMWNTGSVAAGDIIGSEPEMTGLVDTLSNPNVDPTAAGHLGVCPTSGVNYPDTSNTLRLVGESQSGNEYLLTAPLNGAMSVASGNCGTGPVSGGGPVQAGAPNDGTVPTLSGTPLVGSANSITGTAGIWGGYPTYTFQWLVCTGSTGTGCSPATGAVTNQNGSSSYTPVAADAGDYLELQVTAANSKGSASETSAPSSTPVYEIPTNTSAPAITGSAVVGQQLSIQSATDTWQEYPGPATLSYQWSDCTGVSGSTGTGCTAITGATSSTYTLQSSDEGNYVEVTVQATNSAGSGSSTSAVTNMVITQPTSMSITAAQASNVISWQNPTLPPNATISVERSDDGGSTWTKLATLSPSATTYTDTPPNFSNEYDVVYTVGGATADLKAAGPSPRTISLTATSNGTFNAGSYPGMSSFLAELWGAGGGISGNSPCCYGGGGGGGGAYATYQPTGYANMPTGSYSYTVGTAGASQATVGGAGGATTFHGVTAGGGQGGANGDQDVYGQGEAQNPAWNSTITIYYYAYGGPGGTCSGSYTSCENGGHGGNGMGYNCTNASPPTPTGGSSTGYAGGGGGGGGGSTCDFGTVNGATGGSSSYGSGGGGGDTGGDGGRGGGGPNTGSNGEIVFWLTYRPTTTSP